MADRFSTTEKNIIDRDNRNMAAAGIAMGTELNELWAAIDTGPIGITADAPDLDSLAKGGGLFSRDFDNDSGLTFALKAGKLYVPGTGLVSVAASTTSLSASTMNYVEVSPAGVVSKNTVGFTAGSYPLYTVVAGVASITESNVVKVKPLAFVLPAAGLPGSVLSSAQKKRVIFRSAGTLSATIATIILPPVPFAGTLTRLSITVETTVAASDTDYWTFALTNKGTGGAGSTAMLDASANTTKVTGGAAVTALVRRTLTLHGTGSNLVVADGDVLVFGAAKTAGGPNLVQLEIEAEFSVEG